jgi:two-component system, NarL family, sensor histidine kinase UhpB
MKRVLPWILCTFLFCSSSAQPYRTKEAAARFIDSLKHVLPTLREDSNKVNTLLLLAGTLRGDWQLPEGRTNSQAALALSEKIDYKIGKGRACLDIGFTYKLEMEYAKALNYFKEALHIFKELNQKNSLASTTMYIATGYEGLTNYKDARANYIEALKQFETLKSKWGIGECTAYLGSLYFRQENFPEALSYFYLALKQFASTNNKLRMSGMYQSIGAAYDRLKNYPEAIKNFFSSLEISQQLNDRISIGQTLNSISQIYANQSKYDEAVKVLDRALSIFREPNMPVWGLANSYSLLGECYEKHADQVSDMSEASSLYVKALENYKRSLGAWEKTTNKQSIGYSCILIGRVSLKLGNRSEARHYLDRGIELSKAVNNKDNLMHGYLALSMLDSLTGDYKSSYGNYKNYIVYKDSLENAGIIEKAAYVRIGYEFSKKEDSLKHERELSDVKHQQQLSDLKNQQELSDEKLKQQQLLSVQQQQQLLLQQASLKLSNQQRELNRLAFLRTQSLLQAEQNERQQKEKQLLITEQERALEQSQLKLKTTQLGLKENEIHAKKMQQDVVVAASFSILMLGAAFWINNRKKQKAYNLLEKQRMRTQIASDLHDDIGSSLTSISFYSEMVKMQLASENGPVRPMLDKIANNARTIVNTMSDIVWVINPDNDITENLIRRMRNHASELCSERNITYEFQSDDESKTLQLNMQQRKNLYLIYKEALHNAVKYAHCNKININLSQTGDQIKLMVKDDGKGFDVRNAKDGNGLANMKRRADEIKASLTFDTCNNKGTCIMLQLKIT